MHPRTALLLEREQFAQRTPEWYAVRRDMLTASDAAAALGIKPYPSYRGCPRRDLVRKKVTNAPVNNMFVMHGQKYEDEARDWIAEAMGETILEVGLVRHKEHAWLGASPDGVTLTGKLVEIKCPLKRPIKPGYVPEHYYAQMQVQMEVCDVDVTIYGEYKPAALSADATTRQLSLCLVQRDRQWFADNVYALQSCFEEYMQARVNPEAAGVETLVDDAADATPRCLIDDGLYL